MIKSIRLTAANKEDAWDYGHAFSCPKIVDKTFEFGPELNVICGYNGSGKSSLLNIIRKMTFCDKEMVSQINVTNHTNIGLSNLVAEGIFDMTDLQNDWTKSVFSLRPSSEVGATNQDDHIGNLLQMVSSAKSSAGMDTTYSLMELFDAIKTDKLGDRTGIKDFKKMVLDAPMYFSGHTGSTMSISRSDQKHCQVIRDYIASHQADSDRHTIILDEPDRSVDVCMIDSLYKMIVPKKDRHLRHQFLVVFHNPTVLYRLYKEHKDEITWIELTPGYLDNIVRFTEGKDIIRPTAMDWLCKREE